MECKHCKSVIDDSFKYCPNCGKKVLKPSDRLILRNVDWLRFATTEELDLFLPELKTMTTEEFEMWLCGMHENIRVFQIKVVYQVLWKNEWYKRNFCGLSASATAREIKDLFKGFENGKIVSIEAKECKLSKAFKEESDGKEWFRTKEECNAAISTIQPVLNQNMEKENLLKEKQKKLEQEQKTYSATDLVVMPPELLEKLQRKENENG